MSICLSDLNKVFKTVKFGRFFGSLEIILETSLEKMEQIRDIVFSIEGKVLFYLKNNVNLMDRKPTAAISF